MKTITFYSYKGGVGRTLAAANFAIYLAKLGYKTVVIDFDLEAPGIDSKFPSLQLSTKQRGILDYVWEFQQTNQAPKDLESLCVQVPIKSTNGSTLPLFLIPAGDYLSHEYFIKLDQLDWSFIFSEQRNGVAFFQQFLAQIEQHFAPSFLIIDSRTGISEIAGLSTQQLADEVVMFTSLSSESIKMTKHIRPLIQNSVIAAKLNKTVDVKVVVTRTPKPDNLEELKKRCVEYFDVEESKLFFLFSRPDLEQEEFLAINEINKNEELVADYVRLFYGLNIELASESIEREIQRAVANLLFNPPEETADRIRELATLYPHPDVYRAALYFFRLTNEISEMRNYSWKLLELTPDDLEVQSILAKSYIEEYQTNEDEELDVVFSEEEIEAAAKALDFLWQRGTLTSQESLLYADLLASNGQYEKSFVIASTLADSPQLDPSVLLKARQLAAQAALNSGHRTEAIDIVSKIPAERLPTNLYVFAVEARQESGDLQAAYELTKNLLDRRFYLPLLYPAVGLARQLNKINELETVLRNSRSFNTAVKTTRARLLKQPDGSIRKVNSIREEIERLGLTNLAATLSSSV